VTIRKEDRGGELRWVIDIPYQTADGKCARYRRDAQVQSKYGAETEHRRLLVELSTTGTLKRSPTLFGVSKRRGSQRSSPRLVSRTPSN
jgi:hypothetical protein